MKVFVLEGTKGEYDEYVSWVEGVFSSKSKLHDYECEYFKNLETIKQSQCPIDEELYNTPNWYDMASDEEYKLVVDWWKVVGNAKSFNQFNIIECEVDELFSAKLKYE